MDWFKKHADTIVILGSFALCFWNMNEKMNDKFHLLDAKLNAVEIRLTVIETVMKMQKIIPMDFAYKQKEVEKQSTP